MNHKRANSFSDIPLWTADHPTANTTWAGYFCNNPSQSASDQKNSFFLDNFIGTEGRKRKTVDRILKGDQDLLTSFRLITHTMLLSAPSAAFNLPGYNWSPPPVLVAGRIDRADGVFKGARLALVYRQNGDHDGNDKGFFLCVHKDLQNDGLRFTDFTRECCDNDKNSKYQFPRLRGEIVVKDDHIYIENNESFYGSMSALQEIFTSNNHHNEAFITHLFRDRPIEPIYPSLIT